MKRFAILAILLFAVLPAFADSITMYNFVPPIPFEAPCCLMVPGVDQLLVAERALGSLGGIIWFIGVFDTPQISSLTYTFTSAELSAPEVHSFPANSCPVRGAFGGGPEQCFFPAGFIIDELHHPFLPTAGSLTVNLNGTVQTYDFHYVLPAPEPTTLLLFGTGLAAIGWRKVRTKLSA